MITEKEKQNLKLEVNYFLLKNHNIKLEEVTSIAEIVFTNWFEELNKNGSHLISSNIADTIADLKNRYSKNKTE